MRTLKLFSIIAFISLMAWSLCACVAPTTQLPTLPLEASATPTAIATEVKSSPPPTRVAKPTPVKTKLTAAERAALFEDVWSTINTIYFDPDFGGINWNAVHTKYEPLIVAARDDETFFQLLNQMLWELKVSHAGVGPKDQWPSVEPVVWEEGEIGIDVRLLDGKAVITRLEAGSPAEKTGLRLGFIISSIEGTSVEQIIADAQQHLAPPYNDQGRINILTNHLLSLLYGDPGTCVTLAYLDEKGKLTEVCVERIRRPRIGYLGEGLPPFYLEFESRRLESGIGYIRFNTFHPDLIPDIVAAVAALHDTPGIIIDLRGNPGGDPTTAEQLAAQFLDGWILFGSFRTRSGSTERHLNGKNVYSGPLVILIDALSYSASEYFSSGMQTLGRAVIVGERSPGGGTAMWVKILPNDVILACPVAQLLTPDGRVVEGNGIIPDVKVALDRTLLLQGRDTQLEAAIEYVVKRMGK